MIFYGMVFFKACYLLRCIYSCFQCCFISSVEFIFVLVLLYSCPLPGQHHGFHCGFSHYGFHCTTLPFPLLLQRSALSLSLWVLILILFLFFYFFCACCSDEPLGSGMSQACQGQMA
ncbi:hypothetical protein I3760_01G097900 [Carya illinoinensis]|nr:hypothetical protein I3760_01G097900 [Carya illinoinensis]